MNDLPRHVGEVDGTFLSGVFGVPVDVGEVAFLEGGALSDAYRVEVSCDVPGAAVPASVVVKLPCSVVVRRDFAVGVDAYAKEVRFYRDLAGHVPIRSPIVYACRSDGTATCASFVIVMEDLTRHSTVFDQVEDPPGETFVRRIALEAAALHAAYWESPTTDLAWLRSADGSYGFGLDALSRKAPDNVEAFLRLWHGAYGSDLLDGFADVAELTAILCGPRSDAILDHIYAVFSSRPKTLLHGDMRADNIFRSAPGRGRDGEAARLTFIDWQVVHAGPPGPEFTQSWMHSLEPEVRRQDRDILRQYHERLTALNESAAAYTYDMLVADYTAAFCFWWMALITLGAGTFGEFDRPDAARQKRLWGKGMVRAVVAMQDLDCLAVVHDICARLPAAPAARAGDRHA